MSVEIRDLPGERVRVVEVRHDIGDHSAALREAVSLVGEAEWLAVLTTAADPYGEDALVTTVWIHG